MHEAKFYTHEVFTPTKPARLTFVERDGINDKLVSALRTPGKQLVVYGHSGCGKTTLVVNKLNQLYEHHITSRCMRGINFEQLLLDAFDQLAPFYSTELVRSSQNNVSASLSSEYVGLKAQIAAQSTRATQEKHQRILPPQLTAQALGRFLGASRACWVLEDFHKADAQEKTKISQIMKIFMDMADDYHELKIIALGAVDTARQVVQYDPEMRNRVAEVHVPLMTEDEVRAIIQKGEDLLNVKFDANVQDGVVHYSNGLASVCHHLCLNMCTVSSINDTSEERIELGGEALEAALKLYLDEASDSLKHVFDKAFHRKKTRKFDNAKIILRALSESLQEGITRGELYQKIRTRNANYPQANLTTYLLKLESEEYGSIVRHNTTSGKYSFSDPLYRVFALAFFKNHSPKRTYNFEDFERAFTQLRLSLHRASEHRASEDRDHRTLFSIFGIRYDK